jgi:hypothetical protein
MPLVLQFVVKLVQRRKRRRHLNESKTVAVAQSTSSETAKSPRNDNSNQILQRKKKGTSLTFSKARFL